MRRGEAGDSAVVWVLVLALVGLYLLQNSFVVTTWSSPAGDYHTCCHDRRWHHLVRDVERRHLYHERYEHWAR